MTRVEAEMVVRGGIRKLTRLNRRANKAKKHGDQKRSRNVLKKIDRARDRIDADMRGGIDVLTSPDTGELANQHAD